MRVDVPRGRFQWARERAGMDVAALTKRFPRLPEWESGDAEPTLKQLEQFAKATYAPIGFFFQPEPPVEREPIPDFRTVADRRLTRPSPDLLDTVYICQQRQEWYRDFARIEGERRLAFVGSVRAGDDVIRIAAQIRHALRFDLDERRQLKTWTDALRRFVEHADTLGILVMVSGVVGSNNRRKLDPDEFRGFALADDLAPLVFVNGADSKAAQMFTLAHELVHIWIGQSALSDAQASAVPDHEVERWCNQVAAELLVPLEVLAVEFNHAEGLDNEMQRLARHFKVSTLVVLRRLYDTGRVDRDSYWRAYAEEVDRLRSIPKGSGGDFYLTLGTRASKRFTRALVTSTFEGRSSFTEAFWLLGIRKMSTFRELGESFGVSL